MKTIVKFILIASIAIGYMMLCWGCYTKKKAIEKFCKSDSVSVIVHDTIRTETITTDTVFSKSLDTVIIKDGKLSIRYIKVRDSIYINGECEGDTIYLTKEVKVQSICRGPSSYTFTEWIGGQPYLVVGFFIVVFSLALIFIFQLIINALNRFASR